MHQRHYPKENKNKNKNKSKNESDLVVHPTVRWLSLFYTGSERGGQIQRWLEAEAWRHSQSAALYKLMTI
jgi:hypothetical protein